MSADSKYIELIISYSGQEYRLKTYENEYPDLRSLVMKKLNLEWFGECGGMGRCATCMVETKGSKEQALFSSDKENCRTIVMACQTAVNDHLANVTIYL